MNWYSWKDSIVLYSSLRVVGSLAAAHLFKPIPFNIDKKLYHIPDLLRSMFEKELRCFPVYSMDKRD